MAFFDRLAALARNTLRMPGRVGHMAEHLAGLSAALRDLPSASPWAAPVPNSEHALFKELSDRALARTADIVEAEMPEAVIHLDIAGFHRAALARAPREGAHCEFGVFSGQTINFFAEQRPETTFDGFDSFRGLPGEWSGYLPFDFDRGASLPPVRANVRLHAGWFDETLPGYAAGIERVAFLHVDCDIYSSTVTIFRELGAKLAPGCVIVFDEYFCYPGFERHERLAFREFLDQSGRTARWFACCGQRAACVLE
jgi:hypothetical protein